MTTPDAMVFVKALYDSLLAFEQVIDAELSGDEYYVTANEAADLPPYQRSAVVEFVERIALETRHFEIAGFCHWLRERYSEVEHKQRVEETANYGNVRRPLPTKEKDWLTPYDIGRKTDPVTHPAEVNLILKVLLLVEQSAGGWIATKAAEAHAKQILPRSGRKPSVLWRSSVVSQVQASIDSGILLEIPNPWTGGPSRHRR